MENPPITDLSGFGRVICDLKRGPKLKLRVSVRKWSGEPQIALCMWELVDGEWRFQRKSVLSFNPHESPELRKTLRAILDDKRVDLK